MIIIKWWIPKNQFNRDSLSDGTTGNNVDKLPLF